MLFFTDFLTCIIDLPTKEKGVTMFETMTMTMTTPIGKDILWLVTVKSILICLLSNIVLSNSYGQQPNHTILLPILIKFMCRHFTVYVCNCTV